jgi:hypothetical protein
VWRTNEELSADLASGVPARVAGAISDLEARLGVPGEPAMPPPELDVVMAAIDNGLELTSQLTLLGILGRERSFEPRLTEEARRAALIELVLHSGTSRIALETSLMLKGDDDPADAVARALAFLGKRDLNAPRAVEGASWLISFLIAGKPAVRDATLQAIRSWPRDSGHDAVVAFVWPELDAAERGLIGSWPAASGPIR